MDSEFIALLNIQVIPVHKKFWEAQPGFVNTWTNICSPQEAPQLNDMPH